MNKNNNNPSNTMNNQNYGPFNNKKKYGRRHNKHGSSPSVQLSGSRSKSMNVTINNYSIDDLKQIKDNTSHIIKEFSKPVINREINPDRYTPMFEKSESPHKNVNVVLKKQDLHENEEQNMIKHIKMIHILRSDGSPTNHEILNIMNNPTFRQEEIPELKLDSKKEETQKETQKETQEEIEEIIFTDEIKNINDLIKLSKKYPYEENKKYSIDLKKLNNIVPYLQELEDMIGMENIKISLADQLMYFLQGFEYKHALHTIIEGPPGVGKTCLGRILGNIYLNLNCINTDVPEINDDDSKDESQLTMKKLINAIIMKDDTIKEKSKKLRFKIAKRSDLVGQYVGHTAIKTQKIINESFGGVLFIDEAYSLGGDDAFSKECINTINQNLSEHCDKFICIIAGYADSLENNFFSYNSGLHRRFPFRYKIDKYTGIELSTILKNKIVKEKYTFDSSFEKQLDKYIEDNKDNFPNYGGDIETYFFHIKMMHAKRVFGKASKLRNIFIKEDFENGLEKIKINKKGEEPKLEMYT